MYKLILYYDVNPQTIQEYYKFIMSKYIPGIENQGLKMIEAWTTVWGNGPNRQIGFVTQEKESVELLLENEQWFDLNDTLHQFVTDFSYKVVPYRQGFQL